ncbi:GntR family transcriptional regulator [Marispirochaeta sp.]|uniref:GntR family transcriptional regulator n=1 Tax=Marispirochaeta sp. TaxID=2038653 RepID=UPI0029C8D9AF|nr:GntR family transcriptional regulator [Marispirochaeta sp.]
MKFLKDDWETKSDAGSSLTQQVYKDLLSRFLKNEIMPGKVLNRKAIAQELNVSMAPVREALSRLSMEGFVETLPRKGTIVKAISREDVYGSFILREAIECQAARMYCGAKIQENLDQLYGFAEDVDNSYEDMDLVEHWRLDIGFHDRLIHLSSCKTLEVQFKQVMRVGTFYQINSYLSNDDRREQLSHVDLIERLTTKDPDEAEHTIRDHLKSGKRRFYTTIGDNK